MNNAAKILAGALIGSSLTFGGATVFGADTNADLVADKEAILKQYVQAQVRLNEVPTLDLSTASTEEMSKAFGDLATEQDAFTNENLFIALHDKAVAAGTACTDK